MIVDAFKPILVGVDTLDVPLLWERMYRCENFWCRTGMGAIALAGIEGALWDLKGKIEEKPVWELLGGKRHERLLGYATGGGSDYPFEALLRRIDLFRDAGFRAAKFASGWHEAGTGRSFAGGSAQAWIDLENQKLEMIQRHVGRDFVLCLDGHMGNKSQDEEIWTLETAKSVLKSLEGYNIFFFEEALPYRDPHAYAELSSSTTIPVAGGECLTTFEEFKQYADLNSFDIGQPDASFIGIGAFLKVASLFAQKNRRVATHSWGAGGSVMENVHAAFACPNVAILEIPPLVAGLHTEVYGDSFSMVDGYVQPPQRPGLGITLSEATKAKYPFAPGSGEFNSVPGKVLEIPHKP